MQHAQYPDALCPGDHLVSPRPGYSHHGIYIGNNTVIHYSGLHRNAVSGCVCEISVDEFHAGFGFRVQNNKGRYQGQEAVKRARSRLGEDKYHLLFNNCEHFVHWVLHGKARSQQVNNALIGLTTVVLTGVGRWALKKYRSSERV